eukprot:11154981-Lingulodinium_polyedra.AAC.1
MDTGLRSVLEAMPEAAEAAWYDADGTMDEPDEPAQPKEEPQESQGSPLQEVKEEFEDTEESELEDTDLQAALEQSLARHQDR